MRIRFLFSVLLVSIVEFGFVGSSDVDALLEFKKGIQSDPLGQISSSWNSDSVDSNGCPENWFGIQCSAGNVVGIALNDLGLAGNVDFSLISGIGSLQNLSISNNRLMGVLASEIGSIGSLQFLDLSRNLFTGSVPDTLVNLNSLVSLNLSSNNFSGEIPIGFSNLQNLKFIDLHSNKFSGDMGDLFIRFQDPVYVDLSDNFFTGSLPSDFGNSTLIGSVQYVNLSYNFGSVQYVNLSYNLLAGPLFNPMPIFDNLEVFDASYNQLTGQIPSFNIIVSLKILWLRSNRFNGSLPAEIVQESSMVLNDLDLSCNHLQGPIGSITSTTLKVLNLSSNELSGPLPEEVAACAIVDFSNNRLTGNLSAIQNWGNHVEVVHLSSNFLTGTLPNGTYQFLRLTSIKISNNSLSGPLPLVMGSCPELNVIDLSLNQLSGPLPVSFFTSLRLTNLNLSQNSFTGPIPLQNSQKEFSAPTDILPLGQNSSLVSLDLSNNLLSGSLPIEIGTLNQLEVLKCEQNNFSGPIPGEIVKLLSLVYLDLSNNNLSGSIPDDLPSGLKGFNVSYNDLSGTVPFNLRGFPDSSFHPGNTLLIFPQTGSPPRSFPNIRLRGKHGSHMKTAVKEGLIASIVVGVSVMLILSIFIYYRTHKREPSGKDNNQGKYSLPQFLGLRKNTDPPLASLSFSANRLLSSKAGSSSDHGDISAATESAELSALESLKESKQSMKANTIECSSPKRKSSPLSHFSSSPSNDPYLSENPVILKVCSPDKLAGDLYLFDNSVVFTAEELSRSPAEIIGRSSNGTSYKATLDSGHVLIVKWLREGLAKRKKEFAREAKKLGNIRHPNIVSLRGYYWGPKEHEKLILSDYINAECLARHLFETGPRKIPPLSLNQRLKVAVDVARCLNYLHNERAIPHGNLKSTNILLESPDLNACLTDYSLHRIMTPIGMAEQMLNAGALGYRPPEFANSSKPCPSLKSDVYAFGVILMEILTGKSAGEIISGNTGVVDLVDWVRLWASDDRSIECFDRLIPDLDRKKGPPRGLAELLGVSLRCTLTASERPDIHTVFEDLVAIVI